MKTVQQNIEKFLKYNIDYRNKLNYLQKWLTTNTEISDDFYDYISGTISDILKLTNKLNTRLYDYELFEEDEFLEGEEYYD